MKASPPQVQWLIAAGHQLEPRLGLLAEHLHMTSLCALGFLTALCLASKSKCLKTQKKEPGGNCIAFSNVASKVTCHCFCPV